MSVIHNVLALERRGRYSKALALIEAGIRAIRSSGAMDSGSRDVYIDLLRARVKYSIKFCRWERALCDLEGIIRLVPKDGKAHVLRARVYVKSGQYMNAIRVCESSVAFVDRRSPYWAPLHKEWSLAKASLTDRKADPFKALPRELMLKIFRQVIQTTDDIVSVILVSKHWHNFIARSPLLWAQLHFAPSKRYIPYHIIDRFSINSNGVPLDMRISPRVQRPQRFLRKLAQYGNLKHLTIDNSSILLEDLMRERIILANVTSLGMFSSDIGTSLCWALSHMKTLETLKITHSTDRSAACLPHTRVNPQLKIICPLKSLSIRSSGPRRINLASSLISSIIQQSHKSLCSLNLQGIPTHQIPIALRVLSSPNLTEFGLTVAGNMISSPTWNTVIASPLRKLLLGNMAFTPNYHLKAPSLEQISLQSCSMPTMTIGCILKGFNCENTLEMLEITRSNFNLDTLFHQDSGDVFCAKLRRFSLASLSAVAPSRLFIEQLGEVMPNLEFADFTGTRLDNTLIGIMVEQRIKVIKCRSCCQISEENLQLAQKLRVKLV